MPTLTPSTSRWGSDLTPVGHFRVSYDRHGEQTTSTWQDTILTWQEEDTFLKGGKQARANAMGAHGQGREP